MTTATAVKSIDLLDARDTFHEAMMAFRLISSSKGLDHAKNSSRCRWGKLTEKQRAAILALIENYWGEVFINRWQDNLAFFYAVEEAAIGYPI